VYMEPLAIAAPRDLLRMNLPCRPIIQDQIAVIHSPCPLYAYTSDPTTYNQALLLPTDRSERHHALCQVTGVQPLLSPDDCLLAEAVAREDPGVQAMLAERWVPTHTSPYQTSR
jgi:hypothetical protein